MKGVSVSPAQLLLWLCVTLFAVANLVPYLGFDAACFYYGGLAVAHGQLPYIDFIDNKNPGIFYLLALPAAVFKWNVIGAVWLWRAMELAILVIFGRLIRLYAPRVSDSSLVLLCCWTTYVALWAGTYETIYTELPEAVLIGAALWSGMLRGRFGLAGVWIGLALLFRQSAAVGILPLLVDGWLQRVPWRQWFKLGCAALLPIAGVSILAGVQGWRAAWWHYAYGWNATYFSAAGPMRTRLLECLLHLFSNTFLFWAGIFLIIWIGIAATDLWFGRRETWRLHLLVFSWNVAGLVETALMPVLCRHHFICWLPGLALMAAVVLGRAREYAVTPRRRVHFAGLVIAVSLTLIRPTVENLRGEYHKLNNNPDRLVTQYVGHFVQRASKPTERILVWGMAAQLYLQSQRWASSAVYYDIMLSQVGGRIKSRDEDLRRRFEQDLTATPPRFVFLVSQTPFEDYAPVALATCRKDKLNVPGGIIPYLDCVPQLGEKQD